MSIWKQVKNVHNMHVFWLLLNPKIILGYAFWIQQNILLAVGNKYLVASTGSLQAYQ